MKTTIVRFSMGIPLPREPPSWGLPRREPQRFATMEHALYFLTNFPVEGAFEMKMGFITQVPPGTYPAVFAGVKPTTHKEYGSGVRWDFRITDGEHAGAIVGRTTKDVASKKNSCGKFFEMVSGLAFKAAIQNDTDEFVGNVGTIVVERPPSGEGVRVVEFVREDAK